MKPKYVKVQFVRTKISESLSREYKVRFDKLREYVQDNIKHYPNAGFIKINNGEAFLSVSNFIDVS